MLPYYWSRDIWLDKMRRVCWAKVKSTCGWFNLNSRQNSKLIASQLKSITAFSGRHFTHVQAKSNGSAHEGSSWAGYVSRKNISDWTLKGELKQSHVRFLHYARRPCRGRGLQSCTSLLYDCDKASWYRKEIALAQSAEQSPLKETVSICRNRILFYPDIILKRTQNDY